MGTATNILAAPAAVWISPTGTALPDETTVAAGASWGGSWTDLGFTASPLALGAEIEELELEVEQVPAAVGAIATKRALSLEVTLAEFTAANLKIALAVGNTITTVAAGASQHGFDTLKAGALVTMPVYQLGFEAVAVDASGNKLVKRVFIYKAIPKLGGKLEFSRKSQVGIPLQIMALADTTKTAGEDMIEIQNVTAWKTS